MNKLHITHLIKEKKWKEALLLLDNSKKELEEDPLFFNTSYYYIYKALNMLNEAENVLDKALSMNDDNSTLLTAKGVFLLKKNQCNEAINHFTKALGHKANNASIFAYLGKAYSNLNDQKRAIYNYKKACDLNGCIQWYKTLIMLYIQNNNLKEAKVYCKKLLKIFSDTHYKAIYKDIDFQIKNKTKEASNKYYDAVYKNSEKYRISAENTVYVEMWEKIIKIITQNRYKSILDFGCGPGQFAEFIKRKIPEINYTGIDFSAEAIKIAKKKNPTCNFVKSKIPIYNLNSKFHFDVIICTEFLEHVDIDREILDHIPENSPVIASVPNFYSFGHVRFFNSEEEIKARYASFFSQLKIYPFHVSNNSIIWLFFGVRNTYKKKILILTDNPIDYDNRLKKQINFLDKKGYNFKVIEAKKNLKASYFIPISRFKKIFNKEGFLKTKEILNENDSKLPYLSYNFFHTILNLEKYIKDGLKKIKNYSPDFIIANDLIAGAIAYEYNKKYKTPYWYDSHEFQMFRNYRNSWMRALITFYYEKKVVNNAKKISVVSAPIGEYYEFLYNKDPLIFVNNFFKFSPSQKITYNDKKENVLVYFGHLNSGRGIDLWDEVAQAMNAKKIIVFSATKKYLMNLKTPLEFPEPFSDIDDNSLKYLSRYNCYGLCLIEPICISYKLALPNKFFEYKSLGIIPIVMESTYLAEIVKKEKLGYVYSKDLALLANYYGTCDAEPSKN